MKNREMMKIGALFFVLVLALVPLMGMGSAMEVKGGVHASTGDYIKYEMDTDAAENMIAKMGAAQYGDTSVQVSIEKASSDVEFTGHETIEVNGTSYRCIVSTHNMEIKGTMTLSPCCVC